MGTQGGAGLRFNSTQLDTSSYCTTEDTGQVHRVVCLFTFQPKLVFIYRPRSGSVDVVRCT